MAWQVTPGQPGLALYGNGTNSLQLPTGTERRSGAGGVALQSALTVGTEREEPRGGRGLHLEAARGQDL